MALATWLSTITLTTRQAPGYPLDHLYPQTNHGNTCELSHLSTLIGGQVKTCLVYTERLGHTVRQLCLPLAAEANTSYTLHCASHLGALTSLINSWTDKP